MWLGFYYKKVSMVKISLQEGVYIVGFSLPKGVHSQIFTTNRSPWSDFHYKKRSMVRFSLQEGVHSQVFDTRKGPYGHVSARRRDP